MTQRWAIGILAILASVLGVSCSERGGEEGALATKANVISKAAEKPKELTRDSARELLEKSGAYPKKMIGVLMNTGEQTFAAGSMKPEDIVARYGYQDLVRNGLVEVVFLRTEEDRGTAMDVFETRSTTEGLKFKMDPHHGYFVACEEVIEEVTGIRFSSERNKAIAELRTQFSNPTHFAQYSNECRKDGFQDATSYFQLWDDGWRIVKEPGTEFMF